MLNGLSQIRQGGGMKKIWAIRRKPLSDGSIVIYRTLKDARKRDILKCAKVEFVHDRLIEYLIGESIANLDIWEFEISAKRIGRAKPFIQKKQYVNWA